MGGMPTVLLGNGTPQECVDQTKKVIDFLFDNAKIKDPKKAAKAAKDEKEEK